MENIAVIGPPGTGKTYSLMNSIKDLLEKGVHPGAICAVTFTKVAAYEIRHRLIQRFPEYSHNDFPWVGTVHAVCLRVLGVSHSQIFMGKPVIEFCQTNPYRFSPEKLVDEVDDDIEELYDHRLHTLGDWFEHFDSRRRNGLMTFDKENADFIKQHGFDRIPLNWTRPTQQLYCDRKAKFLQDKGYFDFNSLIETTILRQARPPGMRYLFCDEAQDSSPLIWAVLQMWAQGCEQFTCLGDPDQGIYSSFLPAPPENFIRFIESSRRVELQQSYRLPRLIQAVSEQWINRNKNRVQRTFLPRPEDGIVKGYCELWRLPWKDFAFKREDEEDGGWKAFVLARTRWQATQLKKWFHDEGVPYATNRGGKNPLQTARARLAYAFIRLADQEDIPARDMRPMKEWMPAKPWMVHGGKTGFLRFIDSNPDRMIGWQHLLQNGFTPDFMDTLNHKDFLQSLKISVTEKSYLRRVYLHFGRMAFIRTPSVLVTNIHAVKGLEADNVFINPDLWGRPANSFLWDRDGREEERRVGYVGITRAKVGLYILKPDYSATSMYDFRWCKPCGEVVREQYLARLAQESQDSAEPWI
jgi:superfamily I DNA/RNA helicase